MRLPQVKRHLRTHATILRRERQSCPSVANGLIFPGNSLNIAMAVSPFVYDTVSAIIENKKERLSRFTQSI